MIGFLFLTALAALPLIGYPFQRFSLFATLHPAARWGLAGALGALVICLEMVLLSWAGIRWTAWLLLLPAGAVALAGRRAPAPRASSSPEWPPAFVLGFLALLLGTVVYAVGTARATAADFVLFWGAKGQRFGLARSIDVGYLRDPFHALMHSDYPPMLPCLYAWGTLVAGRFAWGAALLGAPLFLTLTVITFFGFAQPVLGRRRAAEYTCVLAALLGFLMVGELVAGDAEPLLFYFEVLTLSALIFAGRRPEGLAAAAIGATGAVLTKVEGTVFVGLAVILYVAFLAGRGGRRRAAIVALAPAVALSAWLAFCWRHGLLDIYRLAVRSKLTWAYLPLVLREIVRQGSSGLLFAPWIIVAVLMARRPPTRQALGVLFVAAGFLTFMVYMYLTAGSEPTLWIQWSAARLLMTPLICCLFAAVTLECPGP